MTLETPIIALVNAVEAAMLPAAEGFRDAFPEATIWNLLDDRLIVDALAVGGLTPELERRMTSLINHAIEGGADGVLLTCSMYSPVAAEVESAANVPVHSSDGAAFQAALAGGYSRIALVASLAIPLADARARFDEFRSTVLHHGPGSGEDLIIDEVLVAEALEPSRAGNPRAVAAAIAQAIEELPEPPDAVLLAQYSIAPAAKALAQRLSLPVLAGPARAADALRSTILGSES